MLGGKEKEKQLNTPVAKTFIGLSGSKALPHPADQCTVEERGK